MSNEEKSEIVRLRDQDWPLRRISKKIKRATSTVKYVLDKWRTTTSLANRTSTDRPKKLTNRRQRHIKFTTLRERTVSARKIARNLPIEVHPRTIRLYLNYENLTGPIPRKKPLLTKRHKKDRLYFAKSYAEWTEEDWEEVYFADETKMNLYYADRLSHVWRHPERLSMKSVSFLVTVSVKYGGRKVMLCGGIVRKCASRAIFYRGQI